MIDEAKVFIAFSAIVAIVIVFVVGIHTQLEYAQDKMITEMVSKGANPIDAACSINFDLDCKR